jgi:hypothetical protein
VLYCDECDRLVAPIGTAREQDKQRTVSKTQKA